MRLHLPNPSFKNPVFSCIVALSLGLLSPSFADTQAISLNGDQAVKFSHSPQMQFKGENSAEGISMEFQGMAGSPNWMQALIPCEWTLPKDGQIELDVRSSPAINRYFAISIQTADGMKYQGKLSDSPTGFKFSTDKTTEMILLSDLVAQDGSHPSADAAVTHVGLVMTTVPEESPKTVFVSEIRLTSDE